MHPFSAKVSISVLCLQRAVKGSAKKQMSTFQAFTFGQMNQQMLRYSLPYCWLSSLHDRSQVWGNILTPMSALFLCTSSLISSFSISLLFSLSFYVSSFFSAAVYNLSHFIS